MFGAFLLGVVIPHDSHIAQSLKAGLEQVVLVLLLPAFFAYTGMRTQIGLVSGWENWLICGLIILVASLGKFGGTLAAARLTGLDWRTSSSLGILMNTRGLMELIVLNIGLDLGVISPTLFAMMVLMALVTTLATTPLLGLLELAAAGQADRERRVTAGSLCPPSLRNKKRRYDRWWNANRDLLLRHDRRDQRADAFDPGFDPVARLEDRCRVALPTPPGVPVAIMSPGSSVTMSLMNATTAATGKICWPVVAFCFTLPLTVSFIFSFCGSGIASAEAMHGPQGQNVSCHLPCSQSNHLSLRALLAARIGAELAVGDVVDHRVAGDVVQGVGSRHVPRRAGR